MSEFQPPDGLNTEEAAELANVLPPTLEEAYAEGRADEREAIAAEARDAIEESMFLSELLRWAYSKLHGRTFTNMSDALELDRMRLYLEHGIAS